MSIKEVDKILYAAISADNPRPRLFVPKDIFLKFVEEVEPLYKDLYGCIICDESATNDGYTNILYKGCAICMEG